MTVQSDPRLSPQTAKLSAPKLRRRLVLSATIERNISPVKPLRWNDLIIAGFRSRCVQWDLPSCDGL
jgi:hypothetical protein